MAFHTQNPILQMCLTLIPQVFNLSVLSSCCSACYAMLALHYFMRSICFYASTAINIDPQAMLLTQRQTGYVVSVTHALAV